MQVKMEAEAGLPDIAKTVLARALQVLVFRLQNQSFVPWGICFGNTKFRNAQLLADCGL